MARKFKVLRGLNFLKQGTGDPQRREVGDIVTDEDLAPHQIDAYLNMKSGAAIEELSESPKPKSKKAAELEPAGGE